MVVLGEYYAFSEYGGKVLHCHTGIYLIRMYFCKLFNFIFLSHVINGNKFFAKLNLVFEVIEIIRIFYRSITSKWQFYVLI